MSAKNVTKQLLTMQDVAAGYGELSQIRGAVTLALNKVDINMGVSSIAALLTIDTTKFLRARVYTSAVLYTDYVYSVGDFTGVSPDDDGSWLVVDAEESAARIAKDNVLEAATSAEAAARANADAALSTALNEFIGIAPNTLGNQLDGSPAYEDFDRPEGFLVSGMTTKSGDPFTISGPGATTAFISGNALSNAGGGNFYATPGTSPTLLTEAWGVVSFSPVGTDAPVQGPQAVIMFTDDGATGLNGGLLHLEITPNTTTMKATTTGAGNLLPLSGTAKYSNGNEGYKKIPIDGSLHRVGLSYIRKDTALEDVLIAHLPFGRSIEYKGDTKIRAVMDGAYWTNWQIITPTAANDGWQPKWHGMAYGQRRSRVPALLAGAPNESDYARLLGKTGGNGDNIKSRIRIDPTAVGWYTIATGVSLSFMLMGGTVSFSGQSNSGKKSKGFITFGWESGRGLVIDEVNFPIGQWSGATQISKFRVSSETSSGGYQLDVHIDEVINNLDFVIVDLEGYFTPVLSPVVGATPLANTSYERVLNLGSSFGTNVTGNATRTVTPGLSPSNIYLPDATAPSQRLILDNTVAIGSDTFHFVRPSSAANGWILENSSDSVAFHTISSGTWCDVAIKAGKFIVVRTGSL